MVDCDSIEGIKLLPYSACGGFESSDATIMSGNSDATTEVTTNT